MKTYKIRKFQNGRNKDGQPFINYSLTIPTPIAEKLPADMQFACELTTEGILFRPADEEVEAVELPTWAKGQNGKTMSQEKTKSQRRAEGAKRSRPRKAELGVPA